MTGVIRAEWHLSYVSQVTPTNWSAGTATHILDHLSPLEFLVADARNIIADQAIKNDYEWLFFVDHDVCLPPNTLKRWNHYMMEGDIPIFGGLYFTRGVPAEPLTYRGSGNGFFNKWKIGDQVWLTGMGLGCTVLNIKLLKAVWEDSEEYQVQPGIRPRKIFETPSTSFVDPETGAISKFTGTEDLAFYDRVKKGDYLAKAGFSKIQKRKNFLLCDTSVFCAHIDISGQRFPSMGEEKEYMRK